MTRTTLSAPTGGRGQHGRTTVSAHLTVGRNDVHTFPRKLQWSSLGGAVTGWHRHRHRAGLTLRLDTTSEGWGLSVATSGDFNLATSGDFYMATDRWAVRSPVGWPSQVARRVPAERCGLSPGVAVASSLPLGRTSAMTLTLAEPSPGAASPEVHSPSARGCSARSFSAVSGCVTPTAQGERSHGSTRTQRRDHRQTHRRY